MKTVYIFIISILLLTLPAGHAHADEYFEINLEMYERINFARSNPLEVIRKFEIDENSAREALGEHQWILDTPNALSPADWSDSLFSSSDSHNRDMLANLYFSYDSLDGRTPADRMREHGNHALETGEIIGAIVLYMYIDPRKAADAVFKYMVMDELNPETQTGINIFNPNLREFAVSFLAGQITIVEGTIANVYLVVADFAHESIYNPFHPFWP